MVTIIVSVEGMLRTIVSRHRDGGARWSSSARLRSSWIDDSNHHRRVRQTGFQSTGRRSSSNHVEPHLARVPIGGDHGGQPQLAHDRKAGAVRERQVLVAILEKQVPRAFETIVLDTLPSQSGAAIDLLPPGVRRFEPEATAQAIQPPVSTNTAFIVGTGSRRDRWTYVRQSTNPPVGHDRACRPRAKSASCPCHRPAQSEMPAGSGRSP